MCPSRVASEQDFFEQKAARKQEPAAVKKRPMQHKRGIPLPNDMPEETPHTSETSKSVTALHSASMDPEVPWGLDEQQALVRLA